MQNKTTLQCYYTFFINGAIALMVGSLLPYVRESYALDYRLAGFLVSAHSVGSLCASLLSGILPLWMGRKKSAFLLVISGILAFTLITMTGRPSFLLLAFFLSGITRGTILNFSTAVINDVSGGKASALNLLHASYCVGALLVPFLVLFFVRQNIRNWVFASWLLALGIASELIIIARMEVPNNYPARAKNAKKDMGFVRNRRFQIVAGILFACMCAEQSVSGWLVTYLKDSGIMTESFSQIMASLLWAVILAGRLSCAALSARMAKHRLLLVNSGGYVLFFVILVTARSSLPCIVGIIGSGYFSAGLYATALSSVSDITSQYPLALSFALGAAGLGGILMPTIVGVAAEHIGIYGGMSAITAAVVLTFLFIVLNARYCSLRAR